MINTPLVNNISSSHIATTTDYNQLMTTDPGKIKCQYFAFLHGHTELEPKSLVQNETDNIFLRLHFSATTTIHLIPKW